MEQEQSQPIFMPPITRIPQRPPRQVAGNRHVYGAPLPETPRPVGAVALPRLLCPARAPIPLSPCPGEPTAQTGSIVSSRGGGFAPPARTPPYCIPGEWSREAEPGVGETLLGCAVLLLIVVFALVVAYFLLV